MTSDCPRPFLVPMRMATHRLPDDRIDILDGGAAESSRTQLFGVSGLNTGSQTVVHRAASVNLKREKSGANPDHAVCSFGDHTFDSGRFGRRLPVELETYVCTRSMPVLGEEAASGFYQRCHLRDRTLSASTCRRHGPRPMPIFQRLNVEREHSERLPPH